MNGNGIAVNELAPFALGAAVVLFVLYVVIRALAQREEIAASEDPDVVPCLERYCGQPLRAVTRTFAGAADANEVPYPSAVLYCANGHCWVETPGDFYGATVERAPQRDCHERHTHGPACPAREGRRCA